MSSAPAASSVGPASVARGKTRAALEIAIAYALILTVIWTPRPWQQYLWIVAVLGIAIIVAASFPGFDAMGLRTRNFFRSLWVVGAALLFAAVSVFLSARLHTLRSLPGPVDFFENFWSYVLWSGVQQFLLQCFFLLRIVRLVPNPRHAALIAAGLFALAHLPNPILFAFTVVWGTLACLVFLRYRNLYPLAIAHAILGITVALAIPGHVDHNMRVGLGYLRYHHGDRQRRLQHSLGAAIGEANGPRANPLPS